MITEFIFVRHGETDANLTGILQGNNDIPLNSAGVAQAAAVAEYLQDFDFDAAYTSNLSRAVETAKIIVGRHQDLELFPDIRLREWNCGRMAGMKWEEIKENYPEGSKAFHSESNDIRMPDGESRMEFQFRVEDFLRETAALHSGGRILVVAHGGVLQRIFRFVCGVVSDNNLIPLAGNASVSSFIYRDDADAWQLSSWNITEHLKGLPLHQTRVL